MNRTATRTQTYVAFNGVEVRTQLTARHARAYRKANCYVATTETVAEDVQHRENARVKRPDGRWTIVTAPMAAWAEQRGGYEIQSVLPGKAIRAYRAAL